MPELDTTAPTDLLLKLLERQQALVEQLAGLADRQRALIDTSDTDRLLAVLAQRQGIMDQFTAGQDSLGRLTEAARREGATEPAMQQRIGTLIEDITSRLARIMRHDEQDRDLLGASRDRVGKALTGLSVAKEARRTYLRARTVNNRFSDRHG